MPKPLCLLVTVAQDKDLVPLIDCLASLLPRLRDSSPLVFTYAPAMFDKAMKLAASQLELRLAGQQEASGGAEFDADALTCSLDLVSLSLEYVSQVSSEDLDSR